MEEDKKPVVEIIDDKDKQEEPEAPKEVAKPAEQRYDYEATFVFGETPLRVGFVSPSTSVVDVTETARQILMNIASKMVISIAIIQK